MTKYLTMNTVIHAAVRRDLDRFDQALDALSPGDQRRADQLWTAWQNYTAQLHGHHEDEETIFWPVLSDLGANEALVSDLDGEHEGMLAAMNRADTAMAALASDASAENTKTAQVAVLEHRHVTLEHLAHEERDLEPFAASHIGSPQMKAALVKVRKAHRGRAGTFFAWLQDGADSEARAYLRSTIPPPVLWVITKIGGRDYRRTVASVWS